MFDGQHDAVEFAVRQVVGYGDGVLVHRFLRVGVGIVDVNFAGERLQFLDEIGDLGVARIGAVFLECEAHDEEAHGADGELARGHGLDDVVGDERRHAVVDAAAGEDDFRMESDRLRFVCQIVGIDADAVAADEARPIAVEIPLGAGCLQYLARLDAEFFEKLRQLVDEGDIEVALDVLDDLGGLRDPDGTRLVRARRDDRAVDAIDEIGGLGRRAGGDFPDARQAAFVIARVDALRAVAGVEIALVGEAREALEDGHADFLGGAGIDRRFVDGDIAFREDRADSFAGLLECG